MMESGTRSRRVLLILAVIATGFTAWFLLRPRYDYVWQRNIILPPSVNTPTAEEYEPNISPDGKSILFTRGSAGHNTDLFIAAYNDGQVGPASPLQGVNTEYDEIDSMLGIDGYLYFYSDRPGGEGGYDLYAAQQRPDGSYHTPVNLGPNVNSEFNDYDPCLSPSGELLYFSSNRHSGGSEEDYDIYVCRKEEKGWSAPKALSAINTPKNEWEPMLDASGRVLYLTSNRERKGTDGGVRTDYDLFASRFGETGWQNPTNMGTEINSTEDEFDPCISPDGRHFLYVQAKRDGEAYLVDIWAGHQKAIAKGSLVRIDKLPPRVIYILLSLIAGFLLLWLLLACWNRMTTLQRCGLGSLVAHCLIAWILTLTTLKSEFNELAQREATYVIYTSADEEVDPDTFMAKLFKETAKPAPTPKEQRMETAKVEEAQTQEQKAPSLLEVAMSRPRSEAHVEKRHAESVTPTALSTPAPMIEREALTAPSPEPLLKPDEAQKAEASQQVKVAKSAEARPTFETIVSRPTPATRTASRPTPQRRDTATPTKLTATTAAPAPTTVAEAAPSTQRPQRPVRSQNEPTLLPQATAQIPLATVGGPSPMRPRSTEAAPKAIAKPSPAQPLALTAEAPVIPQETVHARAQPSLSAPTASQVTPTAPSQPVAPVETAHVTHVSNTASLPQPTTSRISPSRPTLAESQPQPILHDAPAPTAQAVQESTAVETIHLPQQAGASSTPAIAQAAAPASTTKLTLLSAQPSRPITGAKTHPHRRERIVNTVPVAIKSTPQTTSAHTLQAEAVQPVAAPVAFQVQARTTLTAAAPTATPGAVAFTHRTQRLAPKTARTPSRPRRNSALMAMAPTTVEPSTREGVHTLSRTSASQSLPQGPRTMTTRVTATAPRVTAQLPALHSSPGTEARPSPRTIQLRRRSAPKTVTVLALGTLSTVQGTPADPQPNHTPGAVPTGPTAVTPIPSAPLPPRSSVALSLPRPGPSTPVRPQRPRPAASRPVAKKSTSLAVLARAAWTNAGPLSKTLNSSVTDYAANLSPDGKTLLLTRCQAAGPQAHRSRILISRQRANGEWETPKIIAALESEGDDIDASLAPDGNSILFYSNRENGLGAYDIYQAPRSNGVVGPPQNLGEGINTPFDEFDPCFSRDGQTLFFTSNRHSGLEGDHDIYVARRTATGWTQPERLPINTEHHEWEPMLSRDGSTLFFTSDRPGGVGGFDIWMSRFKNGTWQKPVNLGPSVNSPRNEFDPALSPDGARLLFSTNREEGGEAFDLWQVERSVK
ncbi:MAG: hypothetical protein ACYTGH_03095 [Planctomycetota bacterium]|jgi:Tol biopolymer transport system component